jgi:hypothetical protein
MSIKKKLGLIILNLMMNHLIYSFHIQENFKFHKSLNKTYLQTNPTWRKLRRTLPPWVRLPKAFSKWKLVIYSPFWITTITFSRIVLKKKKLELENRRLLNISKKRSQEQTGRRQLTILVKQFHKPA